MKNLRDIELLSSYLDGQLSPSESARLESRLSSDLELASVLEDLRAARGILRKLPPRKAPRNFTLTRQMVGQTPPLPRSYAFFRLSTAFASILFALTFAVNALPRIPLIGIYGGAFGMGGGGGVVESAPAPAAEEPYGIGGGPASTEDAAAAEEALPAATQMPALAAAPTLEAEAAPTVGANPAVTEAPSAKQMESPPEAFAQPPAENQTVTEPPAVERSYSQPLIPAAWQAVLFFVILFSGLTAFLLRRSATQKWK